MQYILTEEELKQIKSDARRQGYRDAEELLGTIMKGHTNVLFVGGPGGKPESIWNEAHKDSPWRKVLEMRDKKAGL